MVQTRGQQTRNQSPPGRGTLQGANAEGDTVATTVSSGNTLKQEVSAPSAEHNATVPMVTCAGQEGLVSPVETGSPTQAGVNARENGRECVDDVSAPKGMSVHPLGTISQAGDGVRMTDRLQKTVAVLASMASRWCDQHPPQHSLQRSAAQTPCWSTNGLRGSGDCARVV